MPRAIRWTDEAGKHVRLLDRETRERILQALHYAMPGVLLPVTAVGQESLP